MNRNNFKERLSAENDTGCVNPPLPLQTFQPTSGIDDSLGICIGLVDRSKFTSFVVPIILWIENSRKCDVFTHNGGRQRFGDLVTDRIWISKYAGGIFESLFRFNVAVGNYLSDSIFPILICGVGDHFGATPLIKVQINIGH